MKTIAEFFEPHQNLISLVMLIATVVLALGVVINFMITKSNPANGSKIVYNQSGKHGINILSIQNGDTISSGDNYSIQAIIPVQQKIRLEITPKVVCYSIVNLDWNYKPIKEPKPITVLEASGKGFFDGQAILCPGICEIRVYENDSKNPIIKTITVK